MPFAYRSYSFVDKDPIIDAMRTAYQDAQASMEGLNYQRVHESSGLSASTVRNWFDGETKRPQYASVVAFARAIGCDVALVRAGRGGKPEIIPVLKKGSPLFNGSKTK